MKLDIFGEIVVTLGTVPQGQGHETTAAQVVADILGVTPDDVTVRAGHDTYWNSHAGFSGTYASQFAVTGLGAVKGATDKLAHEIKRVAAGVFGATPDDIELAEGQARLKANAEAAIPFMGIGAIVNANNAILPEDVRDVTLNCRYVYVPPFQLPDKERKFGNLTLTYASQVHVVRRRDRPGDGRVRDRRLRGRRRLRHAHPPADRRGAGARRDRAGARRRDARDLRLRRGGQPADAELLRLPRAARARHAADEERLPRVAVAVHAARREGHGRGRRRRASTRCARRCRTRSWSRGKPTVWRSCNPYHQVWEYLQRRRSASSR